VLYRMALFSVTLGDPLLPQTTPFSTLFVQQYANISTDTRVAHVSRR